MIKSGHTPKKDRKGYGLIYVKNKKNQLRRIDSGRRIKV